VNGSYAQALNKEWAARGDAEKRGRRKKRVAGWTSSGGIFYLREEAKNVSGGGGSWRDADGDIVLSLCVVAGRDSEEDATRHLFSENLHLLFFTIRSCCYLALFYMISSDHVAIQPEHGRVCRFAGGWKVWHMARYRWQAATSVRHHSGDMSGVGVFSVTFSAAPVSAAWASGGALRQPRSGRLGRHAAIVTLGMAS
jgi:hypothetical protein